MPVDPEDAAVRVAVARFVAERSGDAVVVSQLDGSMRWVSASLTRLLGWTLDDLLGRLTTDFIHEDDLADLLAVREAAVSQPYGEGLVRIRNSAGGFPWFRMFVRVLRDEGGVPIGRVSVFRDVDAEVQSRRSLADSEHWYRLLAENVSDFVTMASPEGTLEWSSPSAELLLGWHPEDVYGRPTISFLHPDDRARLVELREEMAQGRASTLRARVERADGQYRWFDLSIKPVYDDAGELVGRVTSYRDVQAEIESQAALAASERRFRLLAENATDVVAQGDRSGIAWVSPSLTAALGWSPVDWVGTDLVDHAHPEDAAITSTHQDAAATATRRDRFRLRNRAGDFHWVESHAGPYLDDEGTPSGWVVSFRVIDDMVRAENELDRRARYDMLTGLTNRHEVFERMRERERRTGDLTAVLFVDVDNFKEVNDRLGHAAGDAVLRALADRVRSTVRTGDIAARIGGDELLVILVGMRSVDDALRLADSLREAAEDPVLLPEGGEARVTVSIGLTMASGDEPTDAIVARADAAMYRAKLAGRNRVELADEPDAF